MAQAPRDQNQITALLGTSSSDGSTPVILYANATTNRLLVDATTTPGGFSTVGDGRKTVAVAGTAEALGASTSTSLVIITALEANTNVVVVGASTVVAASGTRRGKPLMPNESVEIAISNLNLVYLDTVVSGEGVSFAYFL